MRFLVLLLLFSPIAQATLPAALVAVEKNYSKIKTLKLHFEQTVHSSVLGTDRVSSGEIYWKRPSLLRWETKLPDESLLVHDGKWFWYYTPPFAPGMKGQVMKERKNKVASQIAIDLLSGSFRALSHAQVHLKSQSIFSFEPIKGSAGDVSILEVEIDPARSVITRVKLEHISGNKTELKLSRIEFDPDLNAGLFKFSASR